MADTVNVQRASDAILRSVLIGWLLAAIILILATAGDVATLRFPDPDDAMRLLEVRDLLAGQSWWDVSQHRLNGGDFPMHWSRLIDLPLAGVLALAAPLFGPEIATRVALVVVPLLTMLAVMLGVAYLSRRLAGPEVARYAVLLVPLSAPLVHQLRPMRIDHHGWQIALAVAAALLLCEKPTLRRGVLTGFVLAALLTISLEGMPIAAAIAGVAALSWAWQPDRRRFLLGLMWSLFASGWALHLVTRGPGSFVPACDAMAPGWLATLGVAAIGVTAAVMLSPAKPLWRISLLAAAGGVTLTALALLSPDCLSGPFATLPPIVHDIWYMGVVEGRPIWEQSGAWAAMTVGLPIVGLYGTWRAWRAADGEAKVGWAMLLGLLIAATLVAVMVNRAGSTANALAVPGAATLLVALLHRARAVPGTGARIMATIGALLFASPGQVAAIGVVAAKTLARDVGPSGSRTAKQPSGCAVVGEVRVIGRLPPGTVFSPIDIAPDILATTHHRGIAGGYHRNPAALAMVLEAFTGAPEAARARILASGADYVAGCPGLVETEMYRRNYPNGFWAQLERGERFDWLERIPTGNAALAWRVIRPLPSPPPRP